MVSWLPLRGEVLWQQTTFIWGYKTFQKNAAAIECLSCTLLIVTACCHSLVTVVVRFSLKYNLPNLPGVVVWWWWSALLRWLPSLMQTSPQSCWRQRGIHETEDDAAALQRVQFSSWARSEINETRRKDAQMLFLRRWGIIFMCLVSLWQGW